MKRSKISRVDIQVMIFTTIVVFVSVLCVFIFCYELTYKDMIHSLEERVYSIYNHVEESMNAEIFEEINTIEDQEKSSYVETKNMLEEVKSATGVMYLYTAKKNDDGKFVYVIDGLDSSSPDFRNAGDLIEEEISGDLEMALKDKVVLPDDIKKTTWGEIFICYFPIHNQGKVVGVLGIEFLATNQYKTYQALRIAVPFICILACLIAALIAVKLFKRISNPLFRDFTNTDQLTKLKNRNSFEVDIKNLSLDAIHEKCMIVSIDLDKLKVINDNRGHQAGDDYIKMSAWIIQKVVGNDGIVYRTGGDEFVIIINYYEPIKIERILEEIQNEIKESNALHEIQISMSIGYALFDKNIDANLEKTYQRADMRMYENKRRKAR